MISLVKGKNLSLLCLLTHRSSQNVVQALRVVPIPRISTALLKTSFDRGAARKPCTNNRQKNRQDRRGHAGRCGFTGVSIGFI